MPYCIVTSDSKYEITGVRRVTNVSVTRFLSEPWFNFITAYTSARERDKEIKAEIDKERDGLNIVYLRKLLGMCQKNTQKCHVNLARLCIQIIYSS